MACSQVREELDIMTIDTQAAPVYTPPTQTNPPFTSPVTWPFPTTSERWETDYRLRLLESAIIYMWATGVGAPGPPGPPGTTYVVVNANPPPIATAAPSPPEGLLWFDTTHNALKYWDITANSYLNIPFGAIPPSGPAGGDLGGTYPNPTVTMNRPAALAPAAPFQSFVDDLGDMWVAKGGVYGGAWKRARDVLYGYAYRSAALTTSTTNVLYPFDTASRDTYGLFTAPSFIAPIGGLYYLSAGIVFTSGAAGQNVQMYLSSSTSGIIGMNRIFSQGASQNTNVSLSIVVYAQAGDALSVTYSTGQATSSPVGQTSTHFIMQYTGTG